MSGDKLLIIADALNNCASAILSVSLNNILWLYGDFMVLLALLAAINAELVSGLVSHSFC